MPHLLDLLFLLLSFPYYALASSFDLSTLSWTLFNQNGSIAVPGSVPSQAHLDLARAGVITEPLLGMNGSFVFIFAPPFYSELIDFTQRWVWLDNWTYTADLAPIIASRLDSSDQILLVFHGLDTIANIVGIFHIYALFHF
jgi:beta-mannosidase